MSTQSTFSRRLLGLIVVLLPAPVRDRYREEWAADLDGASELGVRPSSIIFGACARVVSIDRIDPVISGMTYREAAWHRGRWSLAYLGTAVILVALLWMAGGFSGRGAADPLAPLAFLGPAIQIVALVSGLIGMLCMAGAAQAALRARPAKPALVALAVPAVIVALVLVIAIFSFMLVAIAPIGLAALLVFAAGRRPGAIRTATGDSRFTSLRARRIVAASLFASTALMTVSAGLLHILVWNPMARVPHLSLAEIYAQLAAANESPGPAFIGGWAGFWTVAALATVVVAALPQRSVMAAMSLRRIVVLGLCLIAGAALSSWIAGFAMGMSLADTFATSGADAAVTGPLLTALGCLTAIAALFVSLPAANHRSAPPFH